MAGWLLELAGYLANWLMLALDCLSEIQPHSFNTTRVPGLAATILAMLGAALLLLAARYTGSCCRSVFDASPVVACQ